MFPFSIGKKPKSAGDPQLVLGEKPEQPWTGFTHSKAHEEQKKKTAARKGELRRAADYFNQIDKVAQAVEYPTPEITPPPSRPYPTMATYGRTSLSVKPQMGNRYIWSVDIRSKDPNDLHPTIVTRHSVNSPRASEIDYDIRFDDRIVGGGDEYEGSDDLLELPFVNINKDDITLTGALGCVEEIQHLDDGGIRKKLICRSNCSPDIFDIVATKYHLRDELERRIRSRSPTEPEIIKRRVEERIRTHIPETVFHKTSMTGALGILSSQKLACFDESQGASTSREHLTRNALIGFAGRSGEVTIEMKIPKESCPIAYTYLDDNVETFEYLERCVAQGHSPARCRSGYPMLEALDAKIEMDLLEKRYPACKRIGIDVIREIRDGRGTDYPSEKEVELIGAIRRDPRNGQAYIPLEDSDIVNIWVEKTDVGADRDVVRQKLQQHMLEHLYGDRVKER